MANTQNDAGTKHRKKASLKEISALLARDPETFATSVIGTPPTWRSGGSVRYLENQSLVVFTSGTYRGRFKSFLDDTVKGDLIDMAKYVRGCDTHAAAELAKAFLGLSGGEIAAADIPPARSPEQLAEEDRERTEKKLRTARWLWSSASETEGREEGLAYLRNRAITADIPSSVLRFRHISKRDLVTRMNVPADQVPATPVVALVFGARNPAGEITAVQQIFTTEGKKVAFENPKRSNGQLAESAVWLGDPHSGQTAVLVEGPETGCSLFQATGLPTCIGLGKANFTKIHLPPNITRLIIATDMEPTGVGLASALRAAQYWPENGIEECGIALPRLNDGDFNDVHQNEGDRAVRHAVDTAFFPAEREKDGTLLVTPDARAAFHAWLHTGIEVAAKVPGRDKDGKFLPLHLDSTIEAFHNRLLVIETPGIRIERDGLRKSRPDVEILTLHENSKEFRKIARNPDDLRQFINAADIHAPDGLGHAEPMFFALRRSDADALKLEGYKSVAIRHSAIDRTDLSFARGREVFVAPIGNGTDADNRLTERLEAAGARVTRLTWQLFSGKAGERPLLRREIPDSFSATEAAREGWSGAALEELVTISKANRKQMRIEDKAREAAQARKRQPAGEKSAESR